jgi:hypothetical protein
MKSPDRQFNKRLVLNSDLKSYGIYRGTSAGSYPLIHFDLFFQAFRLFLKRHPELTNEEKILSIPLNSQDSNNIMRLGGMIDILSDESKVREVLLEIMSWNGLECPVRHTCFNKLCFRGGGHTVFSDNWRTLNSCEATIALLCNTAENLEDVATISKSWCTHLKSNKKSFGFPFCPRNQKHNILPRTQHEVMMDCFQEASLRLKEIYPSEVLYVEKYAPADNRRTNCLDCKEKLLDSDVIWGWYATVVRLHYNCGLAFLRAKDVMNTGHPVCRVCGTRGSCEDGVLLFAGTFVRNNQVTTHRQNSFHIGCWSKFVGSKFSEWSLDEVALETIGTDTLKAKIPDDIKKTFPKCLFRKALGWNHLTEEEQEQVRKEMFE